MEILFGIGAAIWLEILKVLTKKLGTQLSSFVIYGVLFAGALVYTVLIMRIPGVSEQIQEIIKVMSAAVLTYEGIIKRIKPLLPAPPAPPSSVTPNSQGSGSGS